MTGERMRRPDSELVWVWGGSAAPATQARAGAVTLRPRAEHRTETQNTVGEDIAAGQRSCGRRCGGGGWRAVKLDNFEERKRSFHNLSRSAKGDTAKAPRLLRARRPIQMQCSILVHVQGKPEERILKPTRTQGDFMVRASLRWGLGRRAA